MGHTAHGLTNNSHLAVQD